MTPIDVTTVINKRAIHKLAEISVRQNEKAMKYKPLYYLLNAVLLGLTLYYGYAAVKNHNLNQIWFVFILGSMAVCLFYYLRTPPIKFAENKMRKSVGQQWHYVFSEEEIEVSFGGNSGAFEWEEVAAWTEEDDYIVLTIQGVTALADLKTMDRSEIKDLKKLLAQKVPTVVKVSIEAEKE